MVRLSHIAFFVALVFEWTAASALVEGVIAESGALSGAGGAREPRGAHKRRCKKYGICDGVGGHGGHGGSGGYGGYQGGYQGQIPAINIGISQSQSSSSAGSGGSSNGYYPNNYQYNNQRPYGGYGGYSQGGYGGYNQGGYGGYNPGGYGGYNQGGYGGYNQGGYGGYQRPGYFGNGNGGYNSQFNGNYYSGGQNGGPYGFQGPFGDEYSEDTKPENDVGAAPESEDYDATGSYGAGTYASSGAFAYSRSAAKGKSR